MAGYFPPVLPGWADTADFQFLGELCDAALPEGTCESCRGYLPRRAQNYLVASQPRMGFSTQRVPLTRRQSRARVKGVQGKLHAA